MIGENPHKKIKRHFGERPDQGGKSEKIMKQEIMQGRRSWRDGPGEDPKFSQEGG